LIDPDDFSTLEERIASWSTVGAPKTVGGHMLMRRFHPKVIASKHLEIYREVLFDKVKINQ